MLSQYLLKLARGQPIAVYNIIGWFDSIGYLEFPEQEQFDDGSIADSARLREVVINKLYVGYRALFDIPNLLLNFKSVACLGVLIASADHLRQVPALIESCGDRLEHFSYFHCISVSRVGGLFFSFRATVPKLTA